MESDDELELEMYHYGTGQTVHFIIYLFTVRVSFLLAEGIVQEFNKFRIVFLGVFLIYVLIYRPNSDLQQKTRVPSKAHDSFVLLRFESSRVPQSPSQFLGLNVRRF